MAVLLHSTVLRSSFFAGHCTSIIPEGRAQINPIPGGGGQFDPDDHKPYCRARRARTRLTKFSDFVPFHT